MNQFAERHIGPRQYEVKQMLEAVGVSSIDELITQTVPANILLDKPLDLPKAMSESELLDYMKSIGKKKELSLLHRFRILQYGLTWSYST